MLKDCIEILKEKEKEKSYEGKNQIEFYTDAYLLENGTYFVVDLKTSKYEKMTIAKVKDENKKNINEKEPLNSDQYNKIKIFDFLSQPITPKIKIDSGRLLDTTNCFSIGFKKCQYFSIDKKTKKEVFKINNKNSLDEYFERTVNMLTKSNYYSEFQEYEEYINEFIILAKKIIEENYKDEKIKDDDFIKIFADLPYEKYLVLKNIYYDNYAYLEEANNYASKIRKERKDSCTENKIPVNFISLNEKKPFNANKTRKVPAICYEEATDRENRDLLSKYLKIPEKIADFKDKYIEVRNDKQKGFGFEQYEVIPRDIQKIDFSYDNYLKLENKGNIPQNITKLNDLIKTLFWFKYKTEDKEQKNNETWSFFSENIKIWEKTGNFKPMEAQLDKNCLTLIQNTLVLDEDTYKAQIQFNLYESLKTYFIIQKNNNETKDIKENRKGFFMDLYEQIKNKINKNETESIDDDEEFFFIAGQIAKILVLKSEAKDKTDSLAEGVLCSQRTDYLVNEVLKLYEKYMHAIKVLKYKNTKISNLCAMFLKYNPKSKFVNKRMLLAGYLHSPVTYSKNENEEQNEREEA